MSIERFRSTDGFIYRPTCDTCSLKLDGDIVFSDAVKAARREGWIRREAHGDWEDVCPECQEVDGFNG